MKTLIALLLAPAWMIAWFAGYGWYLLLDSFMAGFRDAKAWAETYQPKAKFRGESPDAK